MADSTLRETLKKIGIVTILLLLALVGVPALSYYLSLYSDQTFIQWVEIFGSGGTIGLSAILAYLYLRMGSTQEKRTKIHEDQTKILENQEKYSRMEKEVLLDIEGTSVDDDELVVCISNHGGGTVVGLNLVTSIRSEDSEIEERSCSTKLLKRDTDGLRSKSKMLGPRNEGSIWAATPEFTYCIDEEEYQAACFTELTRELISEGIENIDVSVELEGTDRFGDSFNEQLYECSVEIYRDMKLFEAISYIE